MAIRQLRTERRGRTGRAGRQPRIMSHRARRSRAEAPDEAVELAADEVRRAFAAWAARFVELLVRDFVRPSFRADADVSSETNGANGSCLVWRTDASIRGLFNEVGRARPRKEVLEQAFRMLDKQSADELRTTGVSVSQVVPQAEARRAEWLRGNTDLIKAEEDLRRRVERILQDPLNRGRSVSDIAKMLEQQAGYSTSRAVLTARDQTLKLYGQIQQERQQNAGITKYVWTTSLDERVRPDHAELDGTVQSWSDPPIVDKRTGRRGHPGFDFQCRCTAVPLLDEPTEGEAPAPQARQAELRQRAIAEGRFAAPPPRERAVTPTPLELETARARAEAERRAEAARIQAEREADARIAAAKAEQARLEAARLAAEADARAAAEAKQIAAEAARVAEIERAAAARASAPVGGQSIAITAERLGLTEGELQGFVFSERIALGARGTVAESALRASPAWQEWYGRRAIERYTENSAFVVNRKLRQVGWTKSWAPAGATATERRYYEGLKAIAREAADVMARKASNALPIARGTAVPADLLERWVNQGAVSDPAFQSFSTNINVAQRFVPSESFAGQFAESGTKRVLIRSQTGGGYHYGGTEAEVMFPPGTKLSIRRVTQEGDITVIDVEPPAALRPR